MATKHHSKTSKLDRYFLKKVLKLIDGKLSKLEAKEFRNHIELIITDDEMNMRTREGNEILNAKF